MIARSDSRLQENAEDFARLATNCVNELWQQRSGAPLSQQELDHLTTAIWEVVWTRTGN